MPFDTPPSFSLQPIPALTVQFHRHSQTPMFAARALPGLYYRPSI